MIKKSLMAGPCRRILFVIVCGLVMFSRAYGQDTTAFEVTPTSIDFGAIPISSRAERTFTIRNNSSQNLSFNTSATDVSGGNFLIAEATARLGFLSPGAIATIRVSFSPADLGLQTGRANITTSLGNATIDLRGTGTETEPEEESILAVKPPSVDFNTVNVGRTATSTVALHNVGNRPLTITYLNMVTGQDAGFSIISQPATTQILANQSVTFVIGFKPSKPGAVNGSMLIESDGGNFTMTMRGNGNATQPRLVIEQRDLNFGTTSVGVKVFRTVTLSNVGDTQLTFGMMLRANGSFSIDPLPSNAIEPGQSITLRIGFNPKPGSGGQTITGSLDILSSGNNTTISLRGDVAPEPMLEVGTTSMDFSTVAIGETLTRELTLRNSRGGQLNFSVRFNGVEDGFIFTGPVNTTLAAGESLTLKIGFRPRTADMVTGALIITSNGGNITIILRGQGSASAPRLVVLPASIDFGAVNISALITRSLTLRNAGQGQLNFSIGMNGADSGFKIISQPSITTLGPGQSVSFDVGFRPVSSNAFNGSLDITSNGGNATISLRGRGNAASPVIELGTNTLDFGRVLTGESRSLTVTIRNMGDLTAGPLEISDVLVSTLEGPNSFEITSRPSGPIPPGGSAELQITFKAEEIDSAGDTRGEITITSNAGRQATMTLLGRGFVRLSFGKSGIVQIAEGRILEVPLTLQGRPPADGLTVNLEPQFDGNTLNLLLNQNLTRIIGSGQTFLSSRSVRFTEQNRQVTLLLKLQDIEIGPAATFRLGLAADSNTGLELEPLNILLKPNSSPDLLRTFNCQDCVAGFTQEGDRLSLMIAFFDRNRDANRLVLRLQNDRGEFITLPAITPETVPALPVGAQGLVARLRIGNLGNFGRVTSVSILLQDAAGNRSSATLPDSAGNTEQSVGVELRMKQDSGPRVESIEIVQEQ
jgi:hypothetical protein